MAHERRPRMAQRLIRLRKQRNLTQRQLAEGLGVSTTAIANIEGGLRPTPEMAHRLSSFYGLPLEDFWTPPKVTSIES